MGWNSFFEWVETLTLFFPQKNPIVEGLRAIFGGGNSPNFKFLDGISIPASMIPPEFKFIKNGLCGSGARTRMCFCEENANIEKIVFPRNKNSVTFKDLKRIFAQCRPTWVKVFCYQNCSDLLWEKIVLGQFIQTVKGQNNFW